MTKAAPRVALFATPPLARPDAVKIVLLVAIAVELLVVLTLKRFVTVDGAIHVGGAALIRDLLTGAGGIHLRYVELAPFPAPNLTPELLLAAAMLVVNPILAEKLLIAGYVVALPLALLYAVRPFGQDKRWLAVVAIPLTFTFTLHYGFYNFSYGVAAFLVVAGYLVRMRRQPTPTRAVVLGGLLLLTYSCHLVPYVEAMMFVGVVVGWDLLAAVRARSAALRSTIRFAVLVSVAAAPSLLLAGFFLLSSRSAEPARYRSMVEPILGLLTFIWPLLTFDIREALFTSGLAATVGILVLWQLRERFRARPGASGEDPIAVFATLATLAFVVSPASVASGGSLLLERLALFPIYGAILWLATRPLPAMALRIVAGVAMIAGAGLLVLRWPAYTALSDRSADYLALAPCIARGSTLIQANLYQFVPGPLHHMDPMVEETGVLSAATSGHDLGSVEGVVPFYPVRNRASNNPYVFLPTSRELYYVIPPPIDPLGYEERTDGRVDYIVLNGRSGASAEVLSSGAWTFLRQELDTGYRRVAVSPAGHFEVFERDVPDLRAAGMAARSQAPAVCPAVPDRPFDGGS
jgi:hypothetical protein